MALRSSVQAGAPATTNSSAPSRYLNAAGANSAYSSSLEQSTHDVGTLFKSCVNALFYSVKAKVVNDLIAGTAEEVGGELRAGKTHGKISDGEHEHFRTVLKRLLWQDGVIQSHLQRAWWGVRREFRIRRPDRHRRKRAFEIHDLVGSHFVDIGILVGSEKYLFAAGHVGVTLFGAPRITF